MRKVAKILILIIGCTILTNCASIIHGSRQNIAFSSNPAGADVYINGQNQGKTPVIVNLKRNNNYSVEINLIGYLPYKIHVTKSVDAWIAGNIIFGGLIGLAVDAASGSMYKLTPGQLNARLRNENTASIQKGENIYIAVVMKADPSWEKIGTLQKATN